MTSQEPEKKTVLFEIDIPPKVQADPELQAEFCAFVEQMANQCANFCELWAMRHGLL